jgi:hypothetical protein
VKTHGIDETSPLHWPDYLDNTEINTLIACIFQKELHPYIGQILILPLGHPIVNTGIAKMTN